MVQTIKGPVVQLGMNAAFASPAEKGGSRGFKSRPVHHAFGFKLANSFALPSIYINFGDINTVFSAVQKKGFSDYMMT